ncbi:hypothetical protein [Nostoc sp. C052]|uniref:hypothetical protein n=1 Tax=Nostoc sp. C052 TaxID=2576902 RepID=UPI0021178B08|nr:hypothetical protein [Nostoc sp. C052]
MKLKQGKMISASCKDSGFLFKIKLSFDWARDLPSKWHQVKELRKWTLKEVAHSLPPKVRLSILPALSALTPCLRHTIQHARLEPVSHLNLALGQHGTPTPWDKP